MLWKEAGRKVEKRKRTLLTKHTRGFVLWRVHLDMLREAGGSRRGPEVVSPWQRTAAVTAEDTETAARVLELDIKDGTGVERGSQEWGSGRVPQDSRRA